MADTRKGVFLYDKRTENSISHDRQRRYRGRRIKKSPEICKWCDGWNFYYRNKESQKKVKRVCKEFKATWNWFEWCNDFSKARNYSFSVVPKDFDYIFWMDTDDVISDPQGIREAAREGLDAVS